MGEGRQGPGFAITRPTRLGVLVTLVCFGGGAAVLAAAGALVRNGTPLNVSLLLLLALVVSANALPLQFRFGSNQVLHVWGELALVVGLVLVPAPWLITVTWVGAGLAHALAGRPAVKTFYNAGTAALGTVVAIMTVRLLSPAGLVPHSVGGALTLVAAAVSFALFNDVLASSAVALSQRLPIPVVLRDGFWINHLMALTNAAGAVTVMAFANGHVAALVVLPVVMVLLHWSQSNGLRLAQERDAWQRLDVATRDLNRLDRRAVLETAVVRASELFRADAVEVLITGPGADRVVRGTMRGIGAETPESVDGSVTVVRQTLQASTVRVGELRLCFGTPVQLREREHLALSTFGNALSAALLNASLYEEMRDQAERKAHEAAHDPLTGLSNRTVLMSRGDSAIRDLSAADRHVTLLLIDLDHFKEVNDTLGHDVGDELLREVARRLRSCVRSRDTVVRLGGDEFAILVPDLATPARAGAIATMVLAALSEPVRVDGLDLTVEASIGLACAPRDATDIRDLLRRADLAMYQAKRSSTPIRHYRPSDDSTGFDRLTMIGELRTALERNEFVVLFQPKFDLATGAATGAEALVRWQHRRRGLVAASEFVPVVEQSGMVHPFAMLVLDQALETAAQWGSGTDAPDVAVNLSARNLLDRSLPGGVRALLHRHGIVPSRLVIEITETAMMSELEVVDEVLAGLREVGVQLSVDDFGTGYSSLTLLSRVRVDELKIDRAFVAAMLTSVGHAAIVQSIFELAQRLGLRVVAEGVETPQQLARLRALGCASAQGFHLASPMSGAEATAMFGRHAVLAG